MDEPEDILPPLETLVDRLMGWVGVIAPIVAHMQESQAVSGRTDPPIADALYAIVVGTLAPMAEHREFELGVAARVVEDAIERVAEEILLVPIEERPHPPVNRAQRRARRRR